MANYSDDLLLLFFLIMTLLILAWLSRQVGVQVQKVILGTTRNPTLPMLTLFLLLLPGIVLHEGAHWLMARLLGLKTGKFRVWPQIQGKRIGMGSVSVQRGQLWQDSLVGMAPLLVGSTLTAIIGTQIFAAEQIAHAFAQGRWGEGAAAYMAAFGMADGAVWAYLLFAIANAMMPSASDREPLKPLLVYIVGLAIIYVIFGLPLEPLTAILNWLTPYVAALTSSLIFTILLDAIILAALSVVETLFNRQPPLATPPRSRRSRRLSSQNGGHSIKNG